MATHDFLLIKNYNNLNNIIYNYFNGDNSKIYNKVKINDDIILYIMDTLNFIKCKWVSGEIKNGIDYYGYSLISGKELCKAKIIFESWKNIFEQGDSEIILTGEYSWTEEEKEGQYEKLLINKNELIENLNVLINMCDIACKEGYDILHLGI